MTSVKIVKSRIGFILLVCGGFPLVTPFFSQAQEQKNQKTLAAEDKIIAALLKTFAGTYVKTADINKLKEKQIRRLEQISDEDFIAAYERVFSVIRECPQFKKKFALYGEMSREEFIARIISFDRKQICDIINSIPDEVLSAKFREYLSEKGEGSSETGITQQVSNAWGRITAKAEGR